MSAPQTVSSSPRRTSSRPPAAVPTPSEEVFLGRGSTGSDYADYYLGEGVRSAALQTTLDQAARLLDFPLGAVSIANGTSIHTLAWTGEVVVPVVSRSNVPCDEVISTGSPVTIANLAPIETWSGDPYHRTPLPVGAATHRADGHVETVDYPLLAAVGVRAYVGVPLRGREGTVVGALCLMDTRPHPVTAEQIVLLQQQAEMVEDHLDLHRRRSDLQLILETEFTQDAGQGTLDEARPVAAVAAGWLAATRELRHGIASGQIVVHYEPIVDVNSGQVQAFEALARWQHPRRGLLQPAAFVPLAEDSDLIIDLDLVVLAQAVEQLHHWQRERPHLGMTVNMSGRHLAHLDCVRRIHEVVVTAGVAPSSVGLEITESALISLTPQATCFVEGLRELGFVILFDDFGTGWASLSYLLHLPTDAVKIDRSFTAALSTRVGAALVRSLLTLTDDLGLYTVVEGVQDAADVARIRELGGRLVQGHFYSPAVPAAAVCW